MSRRTPRFSDELHGHPPEFSVVLGGPLYQMLRRWRLAGDGLELLHRRILLITVICWLPLLIFSAWQGQLLSGSAAIPFLKDLEVHIRFLVVVPLLIGAEIVVHDRMRFLVAQFIERDLIAEEDMHRFQSAITSATKLRNSVLVELLLIAVVYLVGVFVIWRNYAALDTETWYSVHSGEGWVLSAAGLWFTFVSLPVFQFLLLRWYFRIFVWARFLWQTSRITLRLVPTHPDRAGGLGFLSSTAYAFVPLLMAHGAMLAGLYAARIFYAGSSLMDFKLETLVLVVFLLCLVQGPLLVFAPQLARAKRVGRREYGLLAARYVRAFDMKWLRKRAPDGEPLMGSADIQSLADLGNSFEVVQSMRITLVSRDAVLIFAAAILAPVVPLALTMMPLEELLRKLFGILF
jgi:hypothetical protein